MDKQEYITCSAIWYKELPTMKFLPTNVDKGLVICGHRHGHCINTLSTMSKLRTVTLAPDGVGEHEQGFLTSHNRFVDRKEGGEIAFAAKQTEELKTFLFSEDIY